MMGISYKMHDRKNFFESLLDDNVVQYDSDSPIAHHIKWGVESGYITVKPVSYGLGSGAYHNVSIIDFTEAGRLYAEFLSL